MPTTVAEKPDLDVPLEGVRHRWTREECAILEKSGVWDTKHLELVEGEVINKMGKGLPHSIVLAYVFGWFLRVFGDGFVVSECTIDLAPQDNPTSEPEPDILVLTRKGLEIQTLNPRPEDIRL